MRLRDVLYAAGLLGGLGALALAFSTHRYLSALGVAKQIGGVEAARAMQSYEEFGQVQLLGLYALAILLFSMFLIVAFTRNDSKRAASVRSERVIAAPVSSLPALETPPQKIVDEPVIVSADAAPPEPAAKSELEPITPATATEAASPETPASQETSASQENRV
jgi:hypothetical protein